MERISQPFCAEFQIYSVSGSRNGMLPLKTADQMPGGQIIRF